MPTDSVIIAGRYEVQDRLGEGAQGMVLEALDRRLHRLVALKLVRLRGGPEGDEAQMRFENEARAAARLSHPGVVAVHDMGRGPDYAWIAMELVVGQSLEEALRQSSRLPVSEAIRITAELLEALSCAHDHSIVHRDVKPANIMLTDDLDPNFGRVRLTDFGIAHLPSWKRDDLTSVGGMVGTPSAMSPEQARGERADARSDIWAAGVVLYRMLTGRKPFEGVGFLGTMHAIRTDVPTPPSYLMSDVPGALDRIVERALRKDAGERYQTAGEMAADLRAVRRGIAGEVTFIGMPSSGNMMAAI